MREAYEGAAEREADLDRAARRDLADRLAERARAGATTNVYARRSRRIIYAALAAVFTVVGLVLGAAPDGGSRAFGWSALALALASVLALLRAWRMRHVPVAVFTPAGVRFRGPFAEDYLPWSELEGAFIVPHQRRFHIGLVPRDLGAVLAAAPPLRRRWLLSNVGTIGAPFSLPSSSELPAHQLFAVLKAYAAAYAGIPIPPDRP